MTQRYNITIDNELGTLDVTLTDTGIDFTFLMPSWDAAPDSSGQWKLKKNMSMDDILDWLGLDIELVPVKVVSAEDSHGT